MIDEEALLKEMGEYVPKTSRYVSCIRIDGKPILPPLITDEYRKELIHQKYLAVSVEKKLNEMKLLTDHRQSVDSGIIASNNEKSWLNHTLLETPRKDLNTPCSGISDNTVNFEAKNLSQIDLTENASSKTLICDDDVWRYLSNCSSEHFNTMCVGVGEYSIDSNASRDFTLKEDSQSEKRSQYDSLCKSLSKLEGNDLSKLLPGNSDEHDNVTHEIDKDKKSHSESHVENNIVNNKTGTSESLGNHVTVELKSLNSAITGANEITRGNNEYDGFPCNEICCKGTIDSDVKFSDSESEEKRVVFVETDVTPKQFDGQFPHNDEPLVDLKNNLILPVCNVTKPLIVKGLESTVEQKTNIGNGDSSQNSDFFNSSCIFSISLQENNEINSPMLSGPVYPPCLADGDDKKPEKYNPLKYSSSKKQIEIYHAEKECEDNFVCDAGDVNRRSSGEIDILETDSTFTEPGGNCIQGFSVNLDCTSISQKVCVETPLSESTSLPEIDFQSCSFATVSQDTPEDTSELCNETNVIQIDDEFCSPKLVRQNSYTLIAPSPILLAHAKASEKLDIRALSEDEKSVSSQVKIPRKSWDVPKAKNNWNSVKGVKYVYTVPESPDHDSVIKEPSFKCSDRKSSKCKVSSLPGSSVTSPIKINPYFSSVDNLPIVSVRKFQEYISSKSKVASLSAVSSDVPSKNELIEQKRELSNSTTFLDIILNKNNELRKMKTDINDIICDERTNEDFISGNDSKENQENHDHYCTNIEETYKCTNFSQSSTNIDQGEMVEEIAPKNCHSYQNDSGNNCIDRPNDVPHFYDHRNLQKSDMDDSSKHLNPSLYDNTVQQIFLQLQNQHSHLMAQLLDRQKKEQEALANTFLNQQRQILREMRLIPADSTERKQASSNVDVSHRSLDSCKKSQVLSEHQFKDSSSREPCPSTLQTPRTLENIPLYDNSYITMKVDDAEDFIPHYKGRQLFTLSAPQHQRISEYSKDQVKAATTINAFARGYLVRRLLKTEHVQEIIKTISESVMCALQLQRECPVDITPSDVELHRRLIQQLTAACHSLHETFFSLSIQEKMMIIANDRDKRQMQVVRPMSAKSAISAATQKYLQRKQQQHRSSRQSDRPVSTTRRSWWQNKGRASSAGNCELSSSCHAKQPNVMSSKQQSCSIRSTRRPWR